MDSNFRFFPLRGGRAQPAVAVVPKAALAAALVQPVKTETPSTITATTTTTADKVKKEGEEEKEGEPSWPPRGITIINSPDGDSPGSYR